MLQHEPSSQKTLTSAQIRVTPEELTRAIASLEAKQAEEARQREEEALRNSGTLSIHEAVENLSLSFSENQLWEEIQLHREEDVRANSALADVKTASSSVALEREDRVVETEYEAYDSTQNQAVESNLFAILLAASIAVIIFVIFVVANEPHRIVSSTPPMLFQTTYPVQVVPQNRIVYGSPPTSTTPDADFYEKLRQSQGPYPVYHIVAVPRPSFRTISPELPIYPLAAVPDGYSVYLGVAPPILPLVLVFAEHDTGIIFQKIDEALPEYYNWSYLHSSYHNSQAFPVHSSSFITTRYEGREYLRCWIQRTQIKSLKYRGPITLYTSVDNPSLIPQELVPITIPLDFSRRGGFRDNATLEWALIRPNQTNSSSITLPDGLSTILDEHAWENFAVKVLPKYTPPKWIKIPGIFSGEGIDAQTRFAYSQFDANSIVMPVKDIPNGEQFHAGNFFLEQVAPPNYSNYAPPGVIRRVYTPIPNILVDVRPKLYQPYTFVKINNVVYLQGWVPNKMSEAQMSGHNIDIYSNPTDPEIGYAPTPFRLRLDRCRLISIDNDRFVTVTDVYLDQHAWEKW